MKTARKYASPAEARRAIRERAQTEGSQIAYEAALDLAKDKQAPAQARAAAIATILRIGGFFEKLPTDDADGKEPHEMTFEELTAANRVTAAHARRALAAMERARAARGEEGDLTDEDYDLAAETGFQFDDDEEDEDGAEEGGGSFG